MPSLLASERPSFPLQLQRRLCDDLLELPQMATQARRDHIHRQLAREFPGMLTTPRDDTPRVDLSDMVVAAHEYPGALRTFYLIVSDLYVISDRLLAIKRMIDSVDPEDLLTAEERLGVLDLLALADPDQTAAAFHFSARSTVDDVGLGQADVATLAGYLERFPGTSGRLPPYFEFVDYLGHGLRQEPRQAVHRWMDEVSLRLGYLDRGAVERLCVATDRRLASERRYFLVAEISPDRDNRDGFFLAAWRQRNDEPEESLYQSEQSVTWDEALETAHTLMRELTASVDATAGDRVLEFIVPRCLATYAVDQSMVGSVLRSTIGTTYPLVLRSLDRLCDRALHVPWARNWQWLREHGRTAGWDAVHVVHSHDLPAVQALRGALLREGPPAAVLMLTALPERDELGEDAYTAGLLGGAPVMIWSRDDSTNGDLAEFVESVSGGGLCDLPKQVFELRLRALSDVNPAVVGEHVALIFDDYDRIPERFRLRAKLRSPQQRRPV